THLFFHSRSSTHLPLPSFPTRRSSDLLAHRQRSIHLAQPRRHAALAAELERLAVVGQEMKARDLVAGDAGERLDRGADDFLDVEIEEHTSELQSRFDLVCRLLLEKKKK